MGEKGRRGARCRRCRSPRVRSSPRSTAQGRRASNNQKKPVSYRLSEVQEAALIQYIRNLDEIGMGIRQEQLVGTTNSILKQDHRRSERSIQKGPFRKVHSAFESWQEATIVICMWRSCQFPTIEIFILRLLVVILSSLLPPK